MTTSSYHTLHTLSTPLLTPTQAARYLNLHPETVRAMLRRTDLNGFKIGKEWRIRSQDLPGLGSQDLPGLGGVHS